ncbi:hypothetical protein RvY_18873-2 [Ramazzottius varieornatus]|uniref:Uncharacterized protein n=1 Tax=Ramazzottius varieornatus TaxID=947166 RepID=A0A1D1WBV6_RAMVA|nr:hypothetical protein RvY_18873-2 [Ramazzottius varieornatus]
MVNGEVAEAKKKIPVESLSKEELIVQVKKQMILLQKTKAKYDELQRKFTDLENEQGIVAANKSDDARIAALEAELKQQKELQRKAQEVSNRSVADLELRDYQRTIAQLNDKVTAKDDCILRLTQQLHSCEQLLVEKHNANQQQLLTIQQLTQKNEGLEEELNKSRLASLVNDKTIASLRQDTHSLQARVHELEGTIESHADQQSDLVRTYSTLQETLAAKERLLQQKTAEISRLTVDVSQGRSQHDLLIKEFDEYKVRAQTLLKQQNDTSKVASQQREVEELHDRYADMERELAETRHQLALSQERMNSQKNAKEALQRTLDSERMKAHKTLLECHMKLRTAETNQENLRSVQEKKVESYEGELRSLREMYGSTKDKLSEELLSLRAQNQQLQEKVGSQVVDSRLLMEGPSFGRSKSEEYPVDDCHDSDEGSNGRSSPFSNMPTPLGRTISNMSSNTDKVCTGQALHHFPRRETGAAGKTKRTRLLNQVAHASSQICPKRVPLGKKDLVRFVCRLFHEYFEDGNGVCYSFLVLRCRPRVSLWSS